jgi:hypothetical protein
MVYRQPIFNSYSDNNATVSPCPQCQCMTKRNTRCKLRTCKHQPCCWRHNGVVRTVVDTRLNVLSAWVRGRWKKYIQVKQTNRLVRQWVQRVRTNLKRKSDIETVVTGIYERIKRLADQSGVYRKSKTVKFKNHGKNICFLTAALPRVLRSQTLQQAAVKEVLEAFRYRILNQKDYSYAPEFAVATEWMNWNTGKVTAGYALERAVLLSIKDFDQSVLTNATYESLTSELLNHYIVSLALNKASQKTHEQPGPEFWLMHGIGLIEDRWTEIDSDLEFTKTNLIKADDENMHMAYFVTHVLFMANDYGNSPIRPELTVALQVKLFNVMRRWFMNIHTKKAVHQNLEIFFEVSYSMLYLNSALRAHTIPPALWDYFDEMLQLGLTNNFAQSPLAKKSRHNVYFPHDPRVDGFFADYHAHLVMGFFLVECGRYMSRQQPSVTYQLPPMLDDDKKIDPMDVVFNVGDISDLDVLFGNENKNPAFDALVTGGYAVLTRSENDVFCTTHLQEFSEALLVQQKSHNVDDLLYQQSRDSHTIVVPTNPTIELTAALEALVFPTGLWDYLRNRIADSFGIARKRIVIFSDMTYVRIKRRNGSTKAHSDFFHFVESTDLLARIRHIKEYDAATGLCVVCMEQDGTVFDKVALCRKCANGYIPLYTAWLSLGDYTNEKHTLLKVLPSSQKLDYSHINDEKVMEKELPKGLKISSKQWKYPTEYGMNQCDLLLFNCKTIHMAKPSNTHVQPRLSLDVRFAILPIV